MLSGARSNDGKAQDVDGVRLPLLMARCTSAADEA